MHKTKPPVEPVVIPEEMAMKAGMLVERPDRRKHPLVAAIQLALLRTIAKTRTQTEEP